MADGVLISRPAVRKLAEVTRRVLGHRGPLDPPRHRHPWEEDGGSFPYIRFRISENWQADIDCIHGTAVATVTHRSLGATYPDLESQVLLCDMDSCFLNGPPVFLANRVGWAAQLEGEGICVPEGYDSDLPVWCIFSMCSADYRCT